MARKGSGFFERSCAAKSQRRRRRWIDDGEIRSFFSTPDSFGRITGERSSKTILQYPFANLDRESVCRANHRSRPAPKPFPASGAIGLRPDARNAWLVGFLFLRHDIYYQSAPEGGLRYLRTIVPISARVELLDKMLAPSLQEALPR